MLIDLFDKLIDRCIQLAKRSDEASRLIFDDFVEPTYLQFETVHNTYLESFRRYRSAIQDANLLSAAAPALLDQIRTDSLFTINQRDKVREFLLVSASPLVRDFVSSIQRYLDQNLSEILGSAGSAGTGLSVGHSNIWRESLLESIQEAMNRSELTDSEKRDRCVRQLDRLVAQLQGSYSVVIETYSQLRGRLLQQ